MRKIETIKKDIERVHATIEKAEASILGLQARMDNAIARAKKAAAEDAADLIQDLAQRVERYVGTATDCSGLHITNGTHGYSVLNGIMVGEKGRCEVVSKGVAGYNIVCWHIRVNVFPVKG